MENKNNKCPICDNELKLIKNCKNIYTKTCGDKNCISKLRKQTNLIKYGHISNLHSKQEQEKIIKKLQEKYGNNITNVSQIQYVKDKKIETCKKNYGVEYPMQSEIIINKSNETTLKKYGVINNSKIPKVIQKLKNMWYDIDENTGITKLELNLEKIKQTMLDKYGVEYYFQTNEFKDNLKKLMLDKYGVDNVRKSKYYKRLMIERGVWYSDEEKTIKEKYYLDVLKYTRQTFNKYYDLLCITYVRSIDYHLDHIYSIYDGYKNRIDPKIIGSIHNLQIIPADINIKKNKKSWQTLEELINKYNSIV